MSSEVVVLFFGFVVALCFWPCMDQPDVLGSEGGLAQSFSQRRGSRRRGRSSGSELRLGSWNIGSLSKKSIELVKILRDRKVDIVCLQETRWASTRVQEIDG